ncbi:MAG: MlaD family protein [Verrucomicrobiota bacterium]
MENSRLETKVGLFVLLGLVLLGVLMVQFSKGTSLFRSTYQLKLHTENVGGLKQKSAVMLAGVPVGSIQQIQLSPDGKVVTILLKIYRDYPIYTNAMFAIESAGFLGDQFVSITPATNTLAMADSAKFADGAEVDCQKPFNIQQVARDAAGFIQRIDETAKKLDASVTDLRAQVLNAGTLANFGTSITNLKLFTEQALGTLRNINGIVESNSTQVGMAVSNAVLFSEELTRLAASAQALLDTNGATVSVAVRNLADTTAAFKNIAGDVRAGRGLAGAVLQSPELATNVQAIAANLAVTSSNLNRLGLWGILWSHPPATKTNPPPANRPPPARK